MIFSDVFRLVKMKTDINIYVNRYLLIKINYDTPIEKIDANLLNLEVIYITAIDFRTIEIGLKGD